MFSIVLACAPIVCAFDAPPDLSKLISQLGSNTYLEREAAEKSLRAAGESALLPLESAGKTATDPEVRVRAARLLEEVRLKVASQKALTPKMVTLNYVNTPLSTIINELNQKTGIPITLDVNGVRDALRKVTVVSDKPVPMWEAIEMICDAAGLKEVFRPEIPLTNSRRNNRYYGEEEIPVISPAIVPIILTDGKATRLPGSRDTAVRVVALPGNFPGSRLIRGSGEAILQLDITPAPHVNWSDVAIINVLKAEDETGRPVAASRLAELPTFGNGYSMVWMGGGWAINGYYGNQQQRTTMPNPRVVSVTMRTDDRASKRLSVFEGVVVAEAMIKDTELLNVSNLESMIGSAMDAGTQRITLMSYSNEKDGTTKIRMKVEQLPQTSRRRGNNFNPFAAQMIMMESRSGNSGVMQNMSFRTAEGKSTGTPKMGQMTMVESGEGYAQEFDATFAKNNRPVSLVIKGSKTVHLEVPFKMTNVSLP